VDDVVQGKVKGDSKIGKFLADSLSSLPRLNHEQFDHEFNGQLQDLLMVGYLSNMMRAQLNIAQKLSNTTL
jgi:translation initiation factor 3 subunit F